MGLLKTVGTGLMLAACLLPAGCRKYEARPLDGEAVTQAVAVQRRAPEGEAEGPFSFARAARLLAGNAPDLKEARAEYEAALALARVKTPLPNPAFEVGPAFASGSDVDGRRVQPFGSISVAIPLGSRRADQDAANAVRAEAARVAWILRHREAYLALRRGYARLALAARWETESAGIAGESVQGARTAASWAGVGQATPIEAGFLSLEAERARDEALAAGGALAEARARLSSLVGIHPDLFHPLPENPLPDLPGAVAPLADLEALVVADHPELARLRGEYAVAEADLRLEIARQVPDLRLGPSWTEETGEEKRVLGLALGIEIPVFDRNRQAIALAEGTRESVRVRYEAAARRALAELEGARASCAVAAERRRQSGAILAQAEATLRTTRESVQAGLTPPLQLLEAERARRAARAEAARAERDAWEGWSALEEAVGRPLFPFPGETPEAYPQEGVIQGDAR